MKLALIFFATLVVVTHQQYQRSRGMLWLSPYSNLRQVFNNYQPIYYDDVKQDLPIYRQLSPAMATPDSLVSSIYTKQQLINRFLSTSNQVELMLLKIVTR